MCVQLHRLVIIDSLNSMQTLPQFYQLINQSCYHDDKTQHHLCLVDWVNVNRSLSGSDYQIYEV